MLGEKSVRNILARMYLEGLGVPQNYNKAYSIYNKLAFEKDSVG